MAICFTKVPTGMERPTLWKASKNYMKKKFIFDFIATIVAEVFMISGNLKWSIRLRLFRCVRYGDINRPVRFVVNNIPWLSKKKKLGIIELGKLVLQLTLGAHIMTCIWIKIGALDINLPEEERETWMFLTDTMLSADPRSCYDQIRDTSTTVDLLDMYFFSLVFILTAVTSVGYGTNTYSTRLEYLYVICLEILSFLIIALFATSIDVYQSLRQDDFAILINEKMYDMLYFLRKLQLRGEGRFLTAIQYSNIDHHVQDAFLYDFNMIVEEFPFYQMLNGKMQSELVNLVFKDFM